MGTRFLPWKQLIRQHWVGVVTTVFVIVIALMIASYWVDWRWTGISSGESKITITSTPQGTITATEVQPVKNLWDWLGLLGVLAIPVVVGFGGVLFTVNQDKQRDAAKVDNQREAALQTYIDKMSDLINQPSQSLGSVLRKRPSTQLGSQAKVIARARTLTVLEQLDEKRRRSVLQFLYEARLICKDRCSINLDGANLKDANLRDINLKGVNLKGAYLYGADLRGDDTDLSDACLQSAKLDYAKLSFAQLINADLSGARLHKADLSGTNLTRAILIKADLRGAEMNNETKLNETKLEGAKYNTMARPKKNAQGQTVTDEQGNPVILKKTQWPQDFDPRKRKELDLDNS